MLMKLNTIGKQGETLGCKFIKLENRQQTNILCMKKLFFLKDFIVQQGKIVADEKGQRVPKVTTFLLQKI